MRLILIALSLLVMTACNSSGDSNGNSLSDGGGDLKGNAPKNDRSELAGLRPPVVGVSGVPDLTGLLTKDYYPPQG